MAARQKRTRQETEAARPQSGAAADHLAFAAVAGATAIGMSQALADGTLRMPAVEMPDRPVAGKDGDESVSASAQTAAKDTVELVDDDSPGPVAPVLAGAAAALAAVDAKALPMPASRSEAPQALQTHDRPAGVSQAPVVSEAPSETLSVTPSAAPMAAVPSAATTSEQAISPQAPLADIVTTTTTQTAALANTIATQVASAVDKIFEATRSGVEPSVIVREVSNDIAEAVHSLAMLPAQIAETASDAVSEVGAVTGGLIAEAAPSLDALPARIAETVETALADVPQLAAAVDATVGDLAGTVAETASTAVVDAFDVVADAVPIDLGDTIQSITEPVIALPAATLLGTEVEPVVETASAAVVNAFDVVADAVSIDLGDTIKSITEPVIALPAATLLGAEVEPVAKGFLSEIFYDDGAAPEPTIPLASTAPLAPEVVVEADRPIEAIASAVDEAVADIAIPVVELTGLSYLDVGNGGYEGIHSVKDAFGLL